MTLVLNLTLIVQNVSLISYVDKKFHLSLKFFGVSEFGFRNVQIFLNILENFL